MWCTRHSELLQSRNSSFSRSYSFALLSFGKKKTLEGLDAVDIAVRGRLARQLSSLAMSRSIGNNTSIGSAVGASINEAD
jgi:hypothetical protein